MPNKIWKILLILTTILFFYSLLSRQIWITLTTFILAFVIRKQNLFRDYEKKQIEKRQKFQDITADYKCSKPKKKIK